MFITGINNEQLFFSEIAPSNMNDVKQQASGLLTVLRFNNICNLLNIDGQDYRFSANQIVFLTRYHHVVVKQVSSATVIQFNKEFYCLLRHDTEVGCKGLLFYGAVPLPVITIPVAEQDEFNLLFNTFATETSIRDNLQLDMLQMLLKRLLIMCTRAFKDQYNISEIDKVRLDLIREFSYLVEKNFFKLHTVAEYAQLLNKSPKTLANTFLKHGYKPPRDFIQDRIMLEAKRQLQYSEKSVKEIAFDIGFGDVQAFSHFFKRREAMSPSKFRELSISGKNANNKGKIANTPMAQAS